LVQCVKDPLCATRDRINAATFVLSRLFRQQWGDKEDKEKADDSAKAIRDGVLQIASALKQVDKDVDKENVGVESV
jgi:hypothetical protein